MPTTLVHAPLPEEFIFHLLESRSFSPGLYNDLVAEFEGTHHWFLCDAVRDAFGPVDFLWLTPWPPLLVAEGFTQLEYPDVDTTRLTTSRGGWSLRDDKHYRNVWLVFQLRRFVVEQADRRIEAERQLAELRRTPSVGSPSPSSPPSPIAARRIGERTPPEFRRENLAFFERALPEVSENNYQESLSEEALRIAEDEALMPRFEQRDWDYAQPETRPAFESAVSPADTIWNGESTSSEASDGTNVTTDSQAARIEDDDNLSWLNPDFVEDVEQPVVNLDARVQDTNSDHVDSDRADADPGVSDQERGYFTNLLDEEIEDYTVIDMDDLFAGDSERSVSDHSSPLSDPPSSLSGIETPPPSSTESSSSDSDESFHSLIQKNGSQRTSPPRPIVEANSWTTAALLAMAKILIMLGTGTRVKWLTF